MMKLHIIIYFQLILNAIQRVSDTDTEPVDSFLLSRISMEIQEKLSNTSI